MLKNANGTRTYMTNYSTISENYAQSGAGAYFEMSYWGFYSDDKTGSIRGNAVWSDSDENGGGIYAEECKWHTNESMISGITIADNVSTRDGGGVYLGQSWTRIIDCTITGNHANGDGGGIYVYKDNCSIESCTIENNYCDADRQGGGVFVRCEEDITVKGKTFIRNNTRGADGSADDLFLQEAVGNVSRAYIKGGVDAGSKVGVRTGIEGDRRIGIDISTYSYGTYFIDLDGYYVSHGTDEGGDLWQRSSSNVKFTLTQNGSYMGRYKFNELVKIYGKSSDASKVFWYWDTTSASGLNPLSDYINDSNKGDVFISFAMPQNDVSLNAIYADRVTAGKFYIDAPVAGQVLPSECRFSRSDSGRGPHDEITG